MWSSLSCTEVRASRHCFDVALERCKHTPGERRVSFSRTRGCSGTEEGEAELWSCAVGWGLSWAGWCGGERCHPHGVPPPTWAWEAFLLHPFQLAVGGVQLQRHLLRRCERTEGFFHVLFPDRREGEKKKKEFVHVSVSERAAYRNNSKTPCSSCRSSHIHLYRNMK